MREHRVLGMIAAVLFAAVPVARAHHTVFQYGVDRFEMDGNLHGPADGTPDVVDEFDDGVLAPMWQRYLGTVYETNGFMLFQNPGTHFAIAGLPFETDQSDAMSTDILQNGAGNLVMRAFWRPQMVGVNHYLHMTMWTGTYFVGLAFTNFDASIADKYNPPWPLGPTVTAHREYLNGLTLITLDRQHAPLGDSSPAGAFVFEITYDDAAKQVTTAYSVDGGATYHGDFNAMALPEHVSDPDVMGRLIIGADPYEAPPPSNDCLDWIAPRQLGVAGLGKGAGYQSFKMKGLLGVPDQLDLAAEGGTLTVSDDTGAVATVELPAGPGCAPGDGWTQVGSTARYRNDSGALPPACTPGSTGKVRATVRYDGPWENVFKVKVKRTTIGAVSGPLDLDFQRGVTVALPRCQHLRWSGSHCEAKGSRLRCS